MHGVVRNLEEERLRAVLADEFNGAVGQEFRGALWRGATGDGRLGMTLRFMCGFPTLLRGAKTGAAEVPFSKVAGLVADHAEPFGKRLDFEREL